MVQDHRFWEEVMETYYERLFRIKYFLHVLQKLKVAESEPYSQEVS